MSIYGDYQPILEDLLAQTMQHFRTINQQYAQEHGDHLYEHLIGRVKTEASMEEKCKRKNLPLTVHSALKENKDSVGIRVVCNFIDDIYRWIDLIGSWENSTIVKKKDYITNVKPNGYRSYHLILDQELPQEDVDGNTPGHYYVEIQLRTIAMDTWASLEHEMKYKHEVKNAEMISQELKRVADELASCDVSMQTIRQLIREED
ncbi:GTP pyrophosphokinase [Lactobacillus sp. PV034]|uniref:GTP pyrophosphokinase n=1 Tax=Lactobacillus sp. PV034 TaxID=2594495 RepID=UPI00223E9A70|nr:GTP pyrophosphokinase family protein [Lactobacillus sp. PV034]QNQ80200.1 GTP pyrophosphokinase family protein [Lactobacillus sp. PV034]